MFEEAKPSVNTQVIRAPVFQASSPQELDELFAAAKDGATKG